MEKKKAQLAAGQPSLTESQYRNLAAEIYRPAVMRLIILGEAPPPERFFYFGDSLFFRYLRRAFFPVLPETETRSIGWFLSLFREIGGWRTDVCDEPQRASKGGADDVTPFLEAFLVCWRALPKSPEAIVVVSPKRLVKSLPVEITAIVAASVPPPGQWNAHRQAFLHEMERVLTREIGQKWILDAAARVDADRAELEFEIAQACATGAEADEVRRLIRGHPREAILVNVWEKAA